MVSLLQLCCQCPGELSLKIYPFNRYNVQAYGADLLFLVASNCLSWLYVRLHSCQEAQPGGPSGAVGAG